MVRLLIPATALILLAGAPTSSARPPSHKAMVQPVPAARAGCLDNSRYVSHVAYAPGAAPLPRRCGHLLSTDTLLAVRHWDRT